MKRRTILGVAPLLLAALRRRRRARGAQAPTTRTSR